MGDAGFVFDSDGEGLGGGSGGQRRINDRSVTMGVGFEDARGDGRSIAGNQPQFVSFVRRQLGHVAGQEDETATIFQVESFALRLGLRLERDDGDDLSVGRNNRRGDAAEIVEFALRLGELGDAGGDGLLKRGILFPQRSGKDDNRSGGGPAEPSPPMFAGRSRLYRGLRAGLCCGLLSHSVEQALAGPLRRFRSRDRKREQGSVAAKLFQFAAAFGTGGEMLFERGAFVAFQRIERVEGEIVGELFVWRHCVVTFKIIA